MDTIYHNLNTTPKLIFFSASEVT